MYFLHILQNIKLCLLLWMTSYYMGLKAAKPSTALRNQELSGPSGMWILKKGWAFSSTHWLASLLVSVRFSFHKMKKEETEKFNLYSQTSHFCFPCWKKNNTKRNQTCVPETWLMLFLFFLIVGVIIVWQSLPKNPASWITLDDHKLQFCYYKKHYFFLLQKKCMPILSPLVPLSPQRHQYRCCLLIFY